jgi:hypothetical protein
MTITRARLLIMALLAFAACSAPESANRSVRCKEGLVCPDGLTCYRGFCVLDDDAPDTPLLDSGTEPLDERDGATELREASAPSPGATQDAAMAPEPQEAGTSGGPPPLEASTPPDLVDDAATAPGAPLEDASSGGPAPVGDAGERPDDDGSADASLPPPPVDAGMMSSEAINNEVRRCLLVCGANQQRCFGCLRGIIQRHPEVCDPEAPSASEAVLRSLCGVLCLPFCGGQ